MNSPRIAYILMGTLAAIFALLVAALLQGGVGDTVSVYALNIGQGDALLVTQGDTQILIDGGPRGDALLKELTRVLPSYDRTIELVILTHPQADHLAGLVDVVDRYTVETVLTPDVVYDSALFRAWKDTLTKHNTRVIPAHAGQIVRAGRGMAFQIFNPFHDFQGALISTDAVNDVSVVAKLIYGHTTALFTGDAEQKTEYDMLRAHMNVASDVLKVGHHGSRTSSASLFLDAVRPSTALISLGRNNNFGHPHKEVIDRLVARDISIYRTDLLGAIHLTSDGTRWCEEKSGTCTKQQAFSTAQIFQ